MVLSASSQIDIDEQTHFAYSHADATRAGRVRALAQSRFVASTIRVRVPVSRCLAHMPLPGVRRSHAFLLTSMRFELSE